MKKLISNLLPVFYTKERLAWAALWPALAVIAIIWLGAKVIHAPIGLSLLIAIAIIGPLHELYRIKWASYALMALGVLAGIYTPLIYTTNHLPITTGVVIAPLLCLCGVLVIWRDRPGRPAKANPMAMQLPSMIDEQGDQAPLLTGKAVKEGIAAVEAELADIVPPTPFHAMIGRSYLHQASDAANYLIREYRHASRFYGVTAMYAEMNRFDINFDSWYIELATYRLPLEELLEDVEDGLGEYEMIGEPFVLTGTEDLQKAFEAHWEKEKASDAVDEKMMRTVGVCTELICLRMQELMLAAHVEAAKLYPPIGKVPLFSNLHDHGVGECVSVPG